MTDEQELLLASVRDWLTQNVTEQDIQDWYNNKKQADWSFKKWLDAGFGLLGIPEEYGGTPIDLLTQLMVTEEIARVTGSQAGFMGTTLALHDMATFGNEEQVKLVADYYFKTGKGLFALAISEPGAGSDNMAMSTVAVTDGDKVIVNGQKTWVTGGESAEYYLLLAKDENPEYTNTSISMWLVPANLPGISTTPLHKIGNQIAPFCDLFFDNVELDMSMLVGKRGGGFFNLMKNFEAERLLICAIVLGEAQAAMDDAAAYVSKRVIFQKPLGSFQLIQEMLTDMETKLQLARTFLYRCAWELQNGMNVQLNNALLKRYVARAATQVCNDAMQIFGGLGYTTETRVGRCFMDCRGMEIGGGTSETMVHIAGRQIVKKYNK